MNLETIERILREGPPDEPVYVPGAFHRTARPRQWLLSTVAIGLALVVGVLAGIGLDELRNQGRGTASPERVTAADLQGLWVSEPISQDAWVNGLVAQGFDRTEVVAVLGRSTFEQVQYALRFTGSTLTILSSVDGRPLEENSAGTFTVSNGNTFIYAEDVVDDPGLGDVCNSLTAEVGLQAGQLAMANVRLPEETCGREVLIIHVAFFTLAPFDRSSE